MSDVLGINTSIDIIPYLSFGSNSLYPIIDLLTSSVAAGAIAIAIAIAIIIIIIITTTTHRQNVK